MFAPADTMLLGISEDLLAKAKIFSLGAIWQNKNRTLCGKTGELKSDKQRSEPNRISSMDGRHYLLSCGSAVKSDVIRSLRIPSPGGLQRHRRTLLPRSAIRGSKLGGASRLIPLGSSPDRYMLKRNSKEPSKVMKPISPILIPLLA
jgi:hypothetical protein